MFKPVIVIPFYNHLNGFNKIAKQIFMQSIPVIVVDDGSDKVEKNGVKKICDKYNFIFLENKINGGKGVAVKKAFRYAIKHNFTHALQVDADGQHNISDIKEFFLLAKKFPDTIINGCPLYDESVPKARFYGRKITNFWVEIETGFAKIPDSMCGFRVYPLANIKKVLPLLSCERMGFDTEILVKSYLLGAPLYHKMTRVSYPLDGVSHFHTFRDNCQISFMHVKLCVFALLNLFNFRRIKW